MSERDDWLAREIAEQYKREQAEIARRLDPRTRNIARLNREEKEAAPMTLAEVLQPLEVIMRNLRERMDKTACGGDRERVGACFELVERDCPERASGSCPKRVMEYERSLTVSRAQVSKVGQHEARGVPKAIAELVTSADLDVKREPMVVTAEWRTRQPRPRVLVLNGYSQIGKSVAAAWLAGAEGGRFVSIPGEFQHRLKDHAYQARLIGEPTLLVLDDLGLEKLDGFDDFLSAFDGLFCARTDAGKETVVTTNSGNQIRKRYGDRVAQRIGLFGYAHEFGCAK